jgi:hypothetical protein
MNEKRMKRRNNQTEKRKRLILERSAPDYHEIINYQEHWDWEGGEGLNDNR